MEEWFLLICGVGRYWNYRCEQMGTLKIYWDVKFSIFQKQELIMRVISLIINGDTGKDSIILDFFYGSATTAHAVMQMAEDGGHRKFIMVQLPEKTDEKSEAYKAGYKNICEIDGSVSAVRANKYCPQGGTVECPRRSTEPGTR